MTIEELMGELHRLKRADKIRIMRVLAQDLAVKEEIIVPNAHYEAWSPLDSTTTINALLRLLNKPEHDTHNN